MVYLETRLGYPALNRGQQGQVLGNDDKPKATTPSSQDVPAQSAETTPPYQSLPPLSVIPLLEDLSAEVFSTLELREGWVSMLPGKW